MNDFREKVYNVVKKIPKGKAMTYKEVAQKAGFLKAQRAVGNALNKNRDPDVPCHRVIRSDGKVGGFYGGSKKKLKLLQEEGYIFSKQKAPR